jgi:tetratricopeptide (TPR) repeat protein
MNKPSGIACSLSVVALLLTGTVAPVRAQQARQGQPVPPAQEDIMDLTRAMIGLQRAGHYAEALPLAERAEALSEQNLGPDHQTVALYLDQLAWLHQMVGNRAKAEPLFKRALAIQSQIKNGEHVATATTSWPCSTGAWAGIGKRRSS